MTLVPVAATPEPPPADPNAHPSCNGAPVIPAGSPPGTIRIEVRNCVPGLAIRVNGRPNTDGLFALGSTGRVRINLTASGFATLRVDTTITPGTTLVLSGVLQAR